MKDGRLNGRARYTLGVMAGLVPAIHVLRYRRRA